MISFVYDSRSCLLVKSIVIIFKKILIYLNLDLPKIVWYPFLVSQSSVQEWNPLWLFGTKSFQRMSGTRQLVEKRGIYRLPDCLFFWDPSGMLKISFHPPPPIGTKEVPKTEYCTPIENQQKALILMVFSFEISYFKYYFTT